MTQPIGEQELAGPCRGSWTPEFGSCPLPVGSDAVSGTALEAATDILWALSGRQYGLCSRLLRPCRRECYGTIWPAGWSRYGTDTGQWGWPYPALVGGVWINLACAACGEGCSCATVSEALLPGPIRTVESVKVDGVTLTPLVDYRVDDFHRLVRLGGAEWPICNDLNLDDDQVGTWSVEITVGLPLPPLGRVALGVLTSELAKLLMCDSTCALPKPIQSLSRQGVNITFLDPNEVFQNGQTGLYLPDLFIQTVNPKRIARRARVYDIDGGSNRRLVNTPIT